MNNPALEAMAGPQFKLSEEQEMLLRMTRDFVADNIIPVAAEYDEKAIFPEDIFHKARELGIVNMLIPEEYGGVGASAFEETLVSEELGYGCTGIGSSLGVNSLAMLPILIAGSDEQKAYWLGERAADGGQFCSYAVTEANAGSNVAGIETRADKKGAAYIINGSKTFITNAPEAQTMVVMATQDRELGSRGINSFIVEADTPGIEINPLHGKMGIRASSAAEIVFENCAVSEENRMGGEGDGFRMTMEVLNASRMAIAAQCVGIAQAAYDAALAYVKEREAFGSKLSEFQGLQWYLVEMATSIENARLLTLKAATLKDQDRPFITEASMAKLYGSRVAVECADKAVQMHGGAGYFAPAAVERYYRDAKVTEIYEGTTEIQRLIIARNLLRD